MPCNSRLASFDDQQLTLSNLLPYSLLIARFSATELLAGISYPQGAILLTIFN